MQVEVVTDKPNLAPAGARPATRASKGSKVQLSAEGLAAFRRCFPHVPVLSQDRSRRRDHLLADVLSRGRRTGPLDDRRRSETHSSTRLWAELRYVSQYPLAEQKYYSTFMGFVSQDGPEEYQRIKGRDRRTGAAPRRGIRPRAGRTGADASSTRWSILPPGFTAGRWPMRRKPN